jgi:glycosyltransferase involved in cell wall biosynthesis
MRILALTSLYPNPYQPHRAPFNRQQLRALSVQQAVTIIAPIAWTDELVARRRSPIRLPADRRGTWDGITVDYPRYVFPPNLLRGWYGHFFRQSVRASFERAVIEFRPDILYASWAYPDGWAAVELGRRAGLPVVIKVHGSDVLMLDTYSSRRRPTIEALRRADAVVTVSRHLAGRLVQLGIDPQRLSVVYNGIDNDLFRLGPADEARERLCLNRREPIVLYVGNLVAVKGPDILIEAGARLSRDGIAFRFYLIGQGPLYLKLKQQISHYGLEEQVKLLGPKPLEQLPDWYRSADVFVLPSHSEGMPNVLMEAAACGTPFIASRVGGISEIANGRLGRLVPPGDPAALAEAIKQALRGRDLAVRVAGFRPLSWADSAKSLTRVLQSFIR